jgi:hypothetical protein
MCVYRLQLVNGVCNVGHNTIAAAGRRSTEPSNYVLREVFGPEV